IPGRASPRSPRLSVRSVPCCFAGRSQLFTKSSNRRQPPPIFSRHIGPAKTTKGRHMPETPVAGAKAPDFSLVGDDGRKVALKDFRGKKLVLYFYPKADTPGCTREAIAFNGLKSAFAKADTAILGVSADPVKAQDAFKRKHGLAIPLASDETHKM